MFERRLTHLVYHPTEVLDGICETVEETLCWIFERPVRHLGLDESIDVLWSDPSGAAAKIHEFELLFVFGKRSDIFFQSTVKHSQRAGGIGRLHTREAEGGSRQKQFPFKSETISYPNKPLCTLRCGWNGR